MLESTRQEDQIAFKLAAEVYLNRMSIIWSSPLSDFNRIVASNQYALPALTNLMSTQHLPLTEMRKIVVEQGGEHPLGQLPYVILQGRAEDKVCVLSEPSTRRLRSKVHSTCSKKRIQPWSWCASLKTVQ